MAKEKFFFCGMIRRGKKEGDREREEERDRERESQQQKNLLAKVIADRRLIPSKIQKVVKTNHPFPLHSLSCPLFFCSPFAPSMKASKIFQKENKCSFSMLL